MPPDRHGVRLHVQPRASRSEVDGIHGDAIRVRVKAPPVDGAANEELVRFLARRLAVSRSAVRIVAGARSRTKVITVDGMTASAVTQGILRKDG